MAGLGQPAAPHLPIQAPIDAYGNGGFRFAGMSHQGSLLCLPNGIWAWPADETAVWSDQSFDAVFAQADAIDIFLVGGGRSTKPVADAARARFRSCGIVVDAMPTGTAIRTYNVLLGERRCVAAALIAVL